jgi:hypothetical protein
MSAVMKLPEFKGEACCGQDPQRVIAPVKSKNVLSSGTDALVM